LPGGWPKVSKRAQSIQAAASRAGLELIVLDNQRARETILGNARKLVSERCDLAIEFQRYHEIAPTVGHVFATARVPLIAVHVPHPGATYFGPDNYRVGVLAGGSLGEYARRRFRGRPNLFLALHIEEAGTPLHARISGLVDGVEQTLGSISPDRIARVNGGGDREQSRHATLLVLRKRAVKDRIMIGAASDYSALGAMDAVTELGLSGKSVIAGHDGDREAIRSIADTKSPFVSTVAFFPERYGPALVSLALRLLKGENAPPFNYVDYELLDKETVAKDRGRWLPEQHEKNEP